MNKFSVLTLGCVLLNSLHSPLALAETQPSTSAPRLQSLAELDQQPIASRALNIHAWKSPAGGKVLFVRTTELPIIDLHVSFAAGSAQDGAHPGLAAATFSSINEGVPGKNLASILEIFDSLGAKFDMNINHDRASLSLRSLATGEKLDPALQLFVQMLGQPQISDTVLGRIKNQLIKQLKNQQQNPDLQINQVLKEMLLPGHPYAQRVFGTAESVSELTRAQVQDFHRKAYSSGDLLITLVGDLSLEQAQAISLQIINALPANADAMPATPAPQPTTEASVRHIERASNQTHVLLGQLGVTRQHPDYVALSVAHAIFGGQRLSSRLMTELRGKRGLTYTAQLKMPPLQAAGLAVIEFKTRPQYSEGAVALVQSLYRDFLKEGPTQQELDEAKGYLRSVNALTSASNEHIHARLVDINEQDLPLDLDFPILQARDLTVAQIKAALNRHFDADRWSVVTAGPTVQQLPLPTPAIQAPQSMCRAEPGIVAS
ncbi:M16 family metallopeptidase [Pseudomonas frederiksbergensis]|uniref:M16 family metallopeptidase n=1 Tax=Pseudomonas frederiksbergensis TaxID=104087 RepID=UPI000F4624CB|nr:pitrilysin family protein [Pseudomonas frederiksbergensis]RON45995.1 peptidase M16 [Pseudomonas frederiksbergensis]